MNNNCKHIVWMACLRMRHCSLNNYLHRFEIKDEATCECREDQEIVKYYLLVYTKYREQCQELRKKVRACEMRVERLLGDQKLIKHILEYVEDTNCFEF